MVPILAKQAVIIKCTLHSGIIVSNYECAYAMGVFAKLAGVSLPQESAPLSESLVKLLEAAGAYQASDEKEEQLITMLQGYKPDETMDEQVTELLRMGYEEERLWER